MYYFHTIMLGDQAVDAIKAKVEDCERMDKLLDDYIKRTQARKEKNLERLNHYRKTLQYLSEDAQDSPVDRELAEELAKSSPLKQSEMTFAGVMLNGIMIR